MKAKNSIYKKAESIDSNYINGNIEDCKAELLRLNKAELCYFIGITTVERFQDGIKLSNFLFN